MGITIPGRTPRPPASAGLGCRRGEPGVGEPRSFAAAVCGVASYLPGTVEFLRSVS